MLVDDVGFQSLCRHIVVMTDFDGLPPFATQLRQAVLDWVSADPQRDPKASVVPSWRGVPGPNPCRSSLWQGDVYGSEHLAEEELDWTHSGCVFPILAVVSGQKPMALLLGCATSWQVSGTHSNRRWACVRKMSPLPGIGQCR